MTISVGITGGIGSGKTTVTQIFSSLGIPVYYADDAAKKLMDEDEYLIKKIQENFGAAAYKDGKLDRQYMAATVFNDKLKMTILNGIVHPATIANAENWMQAQTSPYALKEAALIFESGAQQYLDKVIGVFAPPALRILRTMKRSHFTREQVIARMDQQMDDAIKMKLCNFVIINDEQQALIPQVMGIHEKLLSHAKAKG
jgi:dephospho-CoA kinase